MYAMTEDQVQKAVLDWTKLKKFKGRALYDYLHHSPNGGKRNKIEAAKFKGMGVKAGYPDLILDIAKGGYHGLRIELKRDKNCYATKNQRDRIEMLKAEGYQAIVAKGLDEAIESIQSYMSLQDSARKTISES